LAFYVVCEIPAENVAILRQSFWESGKRGQGQFLLAMGLPSTIVHRHLKSKTHCAPRSRSGEWRCNSQECRPRADQL